MDLPIWMRILLAIALVAFIAWRVANRWRAASDYSDSMAAEQQAFRALHAQLLQHPGLQRVCQLLAPRGINLSLNGARPGAFHLGLLTLWTDRGNTLQANDPGVRGINAYLQGPKKIVATLVFATGEVHVRDVVMGEWPSDAF